MKIQSKYLESNPDVLGGKLVIKNTRLSIDTLLEHLALGWSSEDLREAYPTFFEAVEELRKKV